MQDKDGPLESNELNNNKQQPFKLSSFILNDLSDDEIFTNEVIQNNEIMIQNNPLNKQTQNIAQLSQNQVNKDQNQQLHIINGIVKQNNQENVQQMIEALETQSNEDNFEDNEADQKINKILNDNIEFLKKLQDEEEQLLDHFLKLSKVCQDKQKLKDLFEAIHYELGIRNKAKQNIYDSILTHNTQTKQTIKDQKKQIINMDKEIKYLSGLTNIKNQRQAGRYKKNPIVISDNCDETAMYDWIIDIDLVTNIARQGWKVTLSDKFYRQQHQLFQGLKTQVIIENTDIQQNLIDNDDFDREKLEGINVQVKQSTIKQSQQWEGALVAVVGLYDKGKTFVLNNLTQSNLPSGKKINTKGISFKYVNMDNGTNLILVDTAGSYSPVKIESEISIIEKETTETFIMDLVFELADYFFCVVNDFTSLDQRYLDKLSRNLQNSPNKTFREIIVIHNLKEVESKEILDHVWETQVTQIYQNGRIQKTKVAAYDPQTQKLMEKHVVWFKTQYTRHICLANDDCPLGNQLNPWVFSLLRYWLKAVFVPVNRPMSVIDTIMNYSSLKLSSYFRSPLTLTLIDTEQQLVKQIKTQAEVQDKNLRLPQISIDSSGLVNTKPDSFVPSIDIISNDSYKIYMDVPGLSADDVQLYRQNVITIVKGIKKKPYSEYEKLEKNERKYGEFTLSFRIPECYERKWSSYQVENGVLQIMYNKDVEEEKQEQ